MKKFYSLSRYPGKTGEYYYNTLFAKLGLPYTYTALECNDLCKSVDFLLSENAAGFSISMPYKHDIIEYLDIIDPLVDEFGSCNTVVISGGKLHGFNADYYAAADIKSCTQCSDYSVLGAGSMGSMLASVLGDTSHLISRHLGNWATRHYPADIIINCTSLGTSVPDSPLDYIPAGTRVVIDLALKSNQLEIQCNAACVKYINGKEFYKNQFMHQFRLYTGIELTSEDFDSI